MGRTFPSTQCFHRPTETDDAFRPASPACRWHWLAASRRGRIYQCLWEFPRPGGPQEPIQELNPVCPSDSGRGAVGKRIAVSVEMAPKVLRQPFGPFSNYVFDYFSAFCWLSLSHQLLITGRVTCKKFISLCWLREGSRGGSACHRGKRSTPGLCWALGGTARMFQD